MHVLLKALASTIAIEYLTFAVIERRLRFFDFGALFLINSFTNPLVLYFHRTAFRNWTWLSGFLFLETCVVFIEAALIAGLFRFSKKSALAISGACNFASAAVGFFI